MITGQRAIPARDPSPSPAQWFSRRKSPWRSVRREPCEPPSVERAATSSEYTGAARRMRDIAYSPRAEEYSERERTGSRHSSEK